MRIMLTGGGDTFEKMDVKDTNVIFLSPFCFQTVWNKFAGRIRKENLTKYDFQFFWFFGDRGGDNFLIFFLV